MLRNVIDTRDSMALAIVRFVLGVVFFMHGAQKVLGWFGGFGFSGTMGFYTGTLHVPAIGAALSIFSEFFGGIALIVGVLSRVAALAIGIDMVVAVFWVHLPNGFFANWNNDPKAGEGYEFHLLAIAMAVAVLIHGAGSVSLDRALSGKPSMARQPA